MLTRRQLLQAGLAAGTAVALSRARPASGEAPDPPLRIVDTNLSLFRWPFRRLPLEDTATLVAKLRSLGITQAWAGTFEGILHRDLTAANARLTAECGRFPELVPVGSIHPALPGWEADLERCAREHGMPGVRLHPNYHGYTLEDSRFLSFLRQATALGLFVQIAVALEDPRTQPDAFRTEDVDVQPLLEVLPQVPGARVQVLNHRGRVRGMDKLAAAGVRFDTARVDGTDAVPALLRKLPAGAVLFGTHAPFLIPEAALIRVHEDGSLEEDALLSVFAGNAAGFRNSGGRP